MDASDPAFIEARTAIVHNYGTAQKADRERSIFEAICGRAKRHHRPTISYVVDRAAMRSYVDFVKGESVDGVLVRREGPVAVECLGFAPLDDRGDVLPLDLKLRQTIGEQLGPELRARNLWLSVTYQMTRRDRCDPRYPMKKNVPIERHHATVIQELRAVIAAAPQPPRGDFVSVYFQDAETCVRWNRFSERLYFDSGLYPECSRHFERVRLQGVYDYMTPVVDSSMTCGAIGLDEEWVTTHLRRKMEQSLGDNKERARGLPLWLLIHSDGDAINRRIPEQHRRRAINLCREILDAGPHGFDRVYWVDLVQYKDCDWVGRII
jgi:hypothetical protein